MKKRRGPLSPKKKAWKKFKKKYFARKVVRNPLTKTKVHLTSFSILRDPNTKTEKKKLEKIRERISKVRQRKAKTPAQRKAKQEAVKKAQQALKDYNKNLAWFNKQVPVFLEEKNKARRAFNEYWSKKGGEKAASVDSDDWADSVLSDILE
jgi:septal ring factor EnvC (AmiA/AmiB activator)